MIGTSVGKYRVVGQLGRGGMGVVYRAVDETLDREVAIKVLNPDFGDSDVFRRFRAEAVTLARLTHPGIATIYELAESEHGLLMVMELVRGESLDRLSARVGTLPPERAAYLIVRVLRALEYAHRAGVVHRDMKPGNVMVTEDGGVKVMDFGVARVRDTAHVTAAGHMIGTPAYMAPEQVRGEEVDGRADLYSVGVMLYRLLTGALPFKADTAIAMAQKQLTEHPTPLGQYRAGLPAWCQAVLERALAKSPADRFQTAEEFRQALARAVPAAVEEAGDGTGFGQLEATTPPRPVPGASPAVPFTPSQPAGTKGTEQATAQPRAAPPGPIAPAAAPTATGDTTIVLRARHLAAAGALLALLAACVAVLTVVVLRRPGADQPPAPGAGASAERTVSTPGPDPGPATQAAGSTAPPPLPSAPQTTSPAATAGPVAPSVGAPTRMPSTAPPPAAPAGRAAPLPAPAEGLAAPTGTSPRTPARPIAPALPAIEVNAKAPAGNGKAGERDVRLVIGGDRMTVRAAGSDDLLESVPYTRLLSISYSRGRNPLWQSPGGPAAVFRAEGGALGVFRGERHWLSLRTRERFVVVRVEGRDADRVVAALEARTGRSVERVASR